MERCVKRKGRREVIGGKGERYKGDVSMRKLMEATQIHTHTQYNTKKNSIVGGVGMGG